MNFGIRTRFPLFELSMFVILVVLGWATYHLYQVTHRFTNADQEWQQHLRRVDQSWKRYVLDVRTLYTTVFDAQHTVRLQQTYYSLAGRLQEDLTSLHGDLTNGVKTMDVTRIDRFERRSIILRDWLREFEVRVQTEVLAGKSLDLQERMQKVLSGTNQPPPLADLGKMIDQTEQALTNYLADAEQLARFVRLDLQGHPAPDYLAKAERQFNRLLELAAEAKRSGEAIDKLAYVPTARAEAMVEFPQRHIDSEASAGFRENDDSELRTVLQTIAAVWIVLLIFSIGAVYRGLVITPLRETLSVSRSLIEYQNKLAHLGQLLASLAHEIRNPLTAINARIYTLQKAVPEGSPEHKDAQVIRSEINRLDTIVKDYLRLTRPADPRFAALKAETVYHELQDLLGPDLEQQGIALKVNGATNTLFKGDPQQIKQVLINIIQNAAEAMAGAGSPRPAVITLSAHRDGSRLGRHREAVALEVEDTGPGIPRDVQEKLFDPFFSTKENGTGLGLAIAMQIVEKHSGKLEFDTTMGQGTTFRVLLPVSEIEEPE